MSNQVNIRFSDDDITLLDEARAELGLGRSAYIRSQLIKNKIIKP